LELRALRDRCEQVFVCGLSMGGTLALRLAARHGDAVDGVVAVNPAMTLPRLQGMVLPVLRHLVPTAPGVAGDIAKEGVREVGYDRVPLHAVHSLWHLLRVVRGELPRVTR